MDDLYAAGVHVILRGHEHKYERFARQNPSGAADPKGFCEFIVGTGWAGGGSWIGAKPNSEAHAGCAAVDVALEKLRPVVHSRR